MVEQSTQSSLKTVADKNGTSSSIGYGKDSDSQSSVTRSGINTQNIQITDEDKQIQLTGKTAEESKAQIHTDTTTDTAQEHSGRLHNVFDKDRVQNELDLQRTVSQDFSQTRQQVNSEINQKIDAINAALENKNLSAAEKADLEKQRDNWQRGNVIINMISAGLSALTQSGAGIVAASASPALSYEIGQHFKARTQEGSLQHILAHAVLGAAVAAAGGNDALAGAISAGGAEVAAPYISKWLYGKTDGSKLTAEQKETVTSITNLLGAATGAAIGDSSANAISGSLNAENAVENNHLGSGFSIFGKEISPNQIEQFGNELDRDCSKNASSNQCLATYNKWKELSYKQGGLDSKDTSWEEFAARMYQQEVLPLCKGNQQCKVTVIKSMHLNIVIYAGDAAGLRDAIERDRRAVNISNGNWVRASLDTLGDLTTLTGMRAMVNPNSAYARLVNSVFVKPSRTGLATPKTQIGAVGSAIPVSTPKVIHLKDGTTLMYQSHSKHTPGQPGFRPNAGIEPRNADVLLSNSIEVGKQRFAFDEKGHIHRYLGGDKGGSWHWAGSTADINNPLSLTGLQKSRLRRSFPDQKRNPLLK